MAVLSADRFSMHKFIGAVQDEWELYSNNHADYTIGAPIGFGASSIVYAAAYVPAGTASTPTPCALKVLDLDRLPPHSLRLLQRETQLMSLSKHPNVLRVRGTWMDGHKLYIAMRLMNAGSAADVMHYGWPGGMEEDVVKCILRQALEGLNYLHINGLIHRDVKAANLLIDDDGTVLLGDLGVAAFLWENEDTPPPPKRTINPAAPSRHHHHAHIHAHAHRPYALGKRKSFVGTPCWMAPEVINGRQYDSSADIWSFGITALELAQGRAPRSRDAIHTVLLRTVQDEPPRLDRSAGAHKYSRAFQEMIERCLDKDPAARPTAVELLQSPFFYGAKKKGYLVGTVLKGLPPLTQRQERSKQPSIATPPTMDSWDFSASPTTSVHHPLALVARDDGPGGNGSAEAYASQIRGQHALQDSAHARKTSWGSEDGHTHPHVIHIYPGSIAEVDLSSSPPATTSLIHRLGTTDTDLDNDSLAQRKFADPVELLATPPLVSRSASSISSEPSVLSSGLEAEVVPPPGNNNRNGSLWKKLTGKGGSGEASNRDTVRRKIEGVFGRTAHAGAGLVRTASRTVTAVSGINAND